MICECQATPSSLLAVTMPFNDCNGSLSRQEQSAVLLVFGCCGIISSITCLIAITVFFLCRMYRKFVHRMVLYILLASLFISLVISAQLLGVPHDFSSGKHHKMCAALGFFMEYSPWVLLLSTTAFTVILTCRALLFVDQNKLARTELPCALLPWTFPLLVAWIPFLHDHFGDSGAWCWIRIFDEDCNISTIGIIEQFALLYADLILLLAINLVLMGSIIVLLCVSSCRKRELSKTHRKTLKTTIPLLAFPIVYGVFTCITFTNRIYRAVSEDDSTVLGLWLVHAIAAPSRGLLAGLAFLVYVLIRRQMESKETYTTLSHRVGEDKDGKAVLLYPKDQHSMENLSGM